MKLFITSKIYDTEKQTVAEIEKTVQDNINNYIGEDKVIFKLYNERKTASLYFYRGVNYSSLHVDPEEMILDADAYLITGEGFNGFRMPLPFPKVPFGYTYSMEQPEFLKAYIGSAEVLGGDKIKKAWLEIDEKKIVLRVHLK